MTQFHLNLCVDLSPPDVLHVAAPVRPRREGAVRRLGAAFRFGLSNSGAGGEAAPRRRFPRARRLAPSPRREGSGGRVRPARGGAARQARLGAAADVAGIERAARAPASARVGSIFDDLPDLAGILIGRLQVKSGQVKSSRTPHTRQVSGRSTTTT